MSLHRRSVLLSCEGPDRVGKETQSRKLTDHLTDKGYLVVRAETPYKGLTCQAIRWMLGNGLAIKWPTLFQLLHHANKLLFQTFVLPRLMSLADVVVLDRWDASEWVYGIASGASKSVVEWCYEQLFKPSWTFVFIGKMKGKPTDDYEKDCALQARVNELYVKWAVSAGNVSILRIDEIGEKEEVHHAVLKELHTHLDFVD